MQADWADPDARGVVFADGLSRELFDPPEYEDEWPLEAVRGIGLVLTDAQRLHRQDGKATLPNVARLNHAPSVERLACLLEHFATVPERVWRKAAAADIAWPLSTCLTAARNADDLLHWAALARAGELGTPEDWFAAQRRWTEVGVRVRDLQASNHRPPIGPDIATEGFPLEACGWTYRDVGIDALAQDLAALLMSSDPGPTRGTLAMLVLQTLSDHFGDASPALPLEIISNALQDRIGGDISPITIDRGTFLRFARPDDAAQYGAALDRLLAAVALSDGLWRTRSQRWDDGVRGDLQQLCREGFSTGAVRLLAMYARSQDASPIPSSTLVHPRDRAAAAFLEGIAGDPEAAGRVFGAAWGGTDDLLRPLSAVTADADDPAHWPRFLTAALTATPVHAWDLREQMTDVLRRLSSRRRSPLAAPERWRALELFERVGPA